MKKLLITFFIIILFLIFIIQINNNPKIIISNLIHKSNIRMGNLKYRINFLGIIPIGEATFVLEREEEYKGLKVYHLNATAWPLKIYAKLFEGYVVLDSYVDMQSLNPLLFKQRVEAPGKENPRKDIFYDQENGTMSMDGVKRQIFPNTQDPLSAIFNLMRMNFANTKVITMNLNTNQKNYILEGIVNQKDILINKKAFRIIITQVKIQRRDKNPYHKSNVNIVLVKNKDENIPVLIKIFASGILINAKLIDIK